jgi:hypothetical protein
VQCIQGEQQSMKKDDESVHIRIIILLSH